jgi:hypothetical protein
MPTLHNITGDFDRILQTSLDTTVTQIHTFSKKNLLFLTDRSSGFRYHLFIMILIIRLVTVAGWFWVCQGNIAQAEQVGLIAQNTNTCKIDSFTAGELLPVADLPTGLTGTFSIAISCTGTASANLLLTLNPSVVHNGGAKMQFVSKSGLLTGANTNPSPNTITVPISSQGNQTGNGSVRLEIVAPSGKLLKAANNYKLVVTAALN